MSCSSPDGQHNPQVMAEVGPNGRLLMKVICSFCGTTM